MDPKIAIVAALVLLFAGCIDGADAGDDSSAPIQDPPNEPAPEPPSPRQASTNSTESSAPQYAPGWPALENATIRPAGGAVKGPLLGAVDPVEATCTSNFLFRSPDNRTLYLGTAAHCVAPSGDVVSVGINEDPCIFRESLPLGSPVFIEGASQPGTLAYASWLTMSETGEDDEDTCRGNDFALIEIAEEDRYRVHPAILHYGGPTRLANSTEVQIDDRVLSYGRSVFHGDVQELEQREGYVTDKDRGEWRVVARMAAPAVPGDSGSPVIDSSGEALGVLVTLTGSASNGVATLDRTLAYASEHAGLDVELVTWELLEEGTLPDMD